MNIGTQAWSLGCAGLVVLAFSSGCSSSDAGPGSATAPSTDGGGGGGSGGGGSSSPLEEARKELIAAGINKYFGKAKPLAPEDRTGFKVYKFDVADGPECLRGGQYEVFVRDVSSENLVIYLEGGGACWKTFCAANETAEALNKGLLPEGGILSKDPAVTPVATWNVVYLPYCDGSVFSGDNDLPNETPPRFHHGLKNLSAGVDLAKSLFPNPKRIFLAGSSAGGYGTLTATGVVRLQYAEPELMVFNDSGVGLSNPDDPTMIEQIRADWKFDQFVPASCTACQGAQLTPIISWALEHDETLKVAAFSAYADSVIAGVFLKMQPDAFKALLLAETGKVHAAYPDRFERFLIDGGQHTTLFTLGTAVNGVTVGDWTKAMVDKTPAWVDTLQ